MYTHFEVTITLLVGIITILTAMALTTRWVYKQGASSQKLINAVNRNTEATTGLSDSFSAYTVKANGTLLDHEKRLTRIETETETEERLRHRRGGRPE